MEALGFTRSQTPCAPTLHNLFKRLDIAPLEAVLTQWAVQTLESLPGATGPLAVAIDGKTLRGSAKQGAALSHLLSVVSHQDASQVWCGVIPQVMAALRNTPIAVLRFAKYQSISQAMRYCAAHPQHAFNLINGKN